jgi:hypothetical protein
MTDFSSLSDADLLAAYKQAKEPAAAKTSNPTDFAKVYGPAAERAGKTLGVDPSMLLGQWGLETGWGKSVIPGTNNLGNIKDFAGGGVAATDNMTGSKDKYRAYDSPEAFADDFASLIQRKYPGAVGAKDPLSFAKALKEGGYAEDPRYVDKVVQASRMAGSTPNPVMKAVGDAVGAVIPSANAAPAKSPLESMSDADLMAAYQKLKPAAKAPEASAGERFMGGVVQGAKDLAGGLVRGAGSIGSTLLAPGDAIQDALAGRPLMSTNNARRQGIDAGLQSAGANPESFNYGAGKLTGEIAGTAGVGGALAKGATALGAAPQFANALASGGMTLGPGSSSGAANMLTRVAGGAITGGASAGLVNPEDAKTGALIGGALPVATKAAGMAGNAIGKALSGGQLAPEVKQLATRAKDLGIDIPADRLVNSKPLNALASSLDYVPGSGRAATMSKMEDQLNTAVSRTFGQDSSNVTQALRKAGDELGGKFDKVLSSNTVKVDQQFLQDLTDATQMASKELGSDGARIIGNQVDEILAKASQTGDIDGQAAYNIKKTLDRIGRRNSPEAFYALDLKQKLMEALNRSLGPAEAEAFKTVRQQYGNMLSLEKIAQNGAEGGISIGRLANMKNISNPQLQELADISAQFLKSREGAHGAAQRVGAGALALGLTGPGGVAAGMATGRGANMLLNSNAMKGALMGQPQSNQLMRLLGEPEAQQFLVRSAPVLGAQ